MPASVERCMATRHLQAIPLYVAIQRCTLCRYGCPYRCLEAWRTRCPPQAHQQGQSAASRTRGAQTLGRASQVARAASCDTGRARVRRSRPTMPAGTPFVRQWLRRWRRWRCDLVRVKAGRAWRLWAARHSHEEAGPLSAEPLPRVLYRVLVELAASNGPRIFTALDHVGADRRAALLKGVSEHAPTCEKLRAQLTTATTPQPHNPTLTLRP